MAQTLQKAGEGYRLQVTLRFLAHALGFAAFLRSVGAQALRGGLAKIFINNNLGKQISIIFIIYS